MLATARNDPRYVFLWLAAAYLGAIHVAVDPRQTEAELEGLMRPGGAEARGHGRGAAGPVRAAGRARRARAGRALTTPAVLIPTSGTTGRSKLVTQTHRAYAMAGEGFPWWIGLTRRRPPDDLAAALPRQRAGLLACSARWPRGPASCSCRASRPAASSTPPAATAPPSSTRSARCSRSSCASPSAPTTPTTRCGSRTPGPAPPKERHLEIERRFGLEMTSGYAMSETPYGTVWAPRHAAVRHARLAAPAPDPRRGERGARERGRRARAAQPRGDEGLLGHAGGDRARCSRPTAGSRPATS